MLPTALQDQATDYVSGAMTATEREALEVVLEFHAGLRAFVDALRATVAVAELAATPAAAPVPSAALRERILRSATARGPEAERAAEALVATDAEGRIEWVNSGFTALCGYSLDELRGRKPGAMLQGAATDPRAIDRIRAAVRERRACRETLVNYHKDGHAYAVDVRIAPILDDDGRPLWFVARERRVPDTPAAA